MKKSKTKKPSEPTRRVTGQVRLMSKHEVCDVVGASFPTIWQWMRDGKFPRSRKLGGKTCWLASEVENWIINRPVKRIKGVDERIKAIVDPALEMVADAIGEIAGEIDGRIDKHIQIYNANEKMIDKNIETIDEDIKNLVALRDQLRKEFKDELVTLRKEFAAKNTKLRRDLQSDTRNVTNLPAIIRSRDER